MVSRQIPNPRTPPSSADFLAVSQVWKTAGRSQGRAHWDSLTLADCNRRYGRLRLRHEGSEWLRPMPLDDFITGASDYTH